MPRARINLPLLLHHLSSEEHSEEDSFRESVFNCCAYLALDNEELAPHSDTLRLVAKGVLNQHDVYTLDRNLLLAIDQYWGIARDQVIRLRKGASPWDLVLRRVLEELNKHIECDEKRIRGWIIYWYVNGKDRDDELRKEIDLVGRSDQAVEIVIECAEQFGAHVLPEEVAQAAGLDSKRYFRKTMPPAGYVSVGEIMSSERFRKRDKNPPRTTIQQWEQRAQKDGESGPQVWYAPDNNESHYPIDWVREQIESWNPRVPRD